MEGEKYNLSKAQEEAEKLHKKVEADKSSNYTESKSQSLGGLERITNEGDTTLLKNLFVDLIKQNYKSWSGFYGRNLLSFLNEHPGVTSSKEGEGLVYELVLASIKYEPQEALKTFQSLATSPHFTEDMKGRLVTDFILTNIRYSPEIALNVLDRLDIVPNFSEDQKKEMEKNFAGAFGSGSYFDSLKKLSKLFPEIVSSEVCIEAKKKVFLETINDERVSVFPDIYVKKTLEGVSLLQGDKEFLESSDVVVPLQRMIIVCLMKKMFNEAIQLRDVFHIDGNSPELKKEILRAASYESTCGRPEKFKSFIDVFPDIDHADVARQIISDIEFSKENRLKIFSFFVFEYPDILDSTELNKEVIEKHFSNLVNEKGSGDLTKALEFKNLIIQKYPDIVSEVVRDALIFDLYEGDIADLMHVINSFPEVKDVDSILAQHVLKNQANIIKLIKVLDNSDLADKLPITFQTITKTLLENLLTNEDLADYFLENLDKYYQQPWAAEGVAKAIQQYSVAQKFIHAVENSQTVWKNEAWVVDVLTKAKVIVEEHKKQVPQGDEQGDDYGYSHGNEGFRESDPFANHPWLFGGQQIRIASAISELMAGEANTQGLNELGINPKEISSLLAEANEKVNAAYQNFLEQIRSNTAIKDEDKQALLNPESSSVKMTSLLNNIRSFVARYFVQSVEGDVTRLSEIGNLSNDLDRILAEGFRRYIKIHEVDVPLYDKLYEEFDTLRETGRSPLEVYLGRDGIYAYIGRHAQDVARRRKLGLEGRKKLKEMGEVVEIHPQYTVYPRYFRDNINQETKRQFLEQEGISPDADPLFYDTGYTGTIPEQIMKVMDFSQEDIERRIRLLSAPSVHRRVKGISENARSEIIEYIEHNAKTENTAEGLIIDKKTGKIRHIAKPTNPEEQFYFMMVKQAVARHYWLQEQLHHEPSGNVNLDSEHYTIRIRQEYAKLLPSDFMQNPKEFLTQHGEMLKGSKGEGEYPDEEVVLFKMTDGTEIVAKKIELRKAKEARKEFSILISAKKAGLPTAEPVGFLSGKEDTDGSYLLMKKIEGISGRNFDKYLRDTGKFTEEKIKSILQQVAQKNKEMAELFRTTLKIDKRWRIKDTIIELNEETGEVENVIPIDWERAQNFNPATPKEIDEIA